MLIIFNKNKTMYKQNINIRKDIRNLKEAIKENSGAESTIIEMKSSLQRFIEFEQVEGRTRL